MIIITPQKEIDKLDNKSLITFECECCHARYTKQKKYLSTMIKREVNRYCSYKCFNKRERKLVKCNCFVCNKEFVRYPSNFRQKANKVFCSKSCAAKHNNVNKTYCSKRSKLEKWLEIKLQKLYPQLEILYTDRKTINSELDIYIPSLKLAFELNGIFHYEPIFGAEQLNKVKNNDSRKFQACLERGIELCIIDSSKLSYFKESNAIPFLDIIVKVINSVIAKHR